MIRKVLLLLFTGLIIYSCATVPVTGRRQLNLVSNSELLPLSYDQYEQVISESKISNNREWANMVKSVGNNIKNAVEQYLRQEGQSSLLNGYAWEFHLLAEDVVNAWCMPGGKVAFYEGIMPICENETGVAVVMGHEVAHAVANHARERFSQTMVAQTGLSTVGAAMGQDPTMTQQLLMQAAGLSTQLGMLKFSRTHESEADHLGIIFMAMAGYDPRESIDFWQRMNAQADGQRPPEFLSTHPHPESRISELQENMPEALQYYKK